MKKAKKTEDEWKKELTPKQFRVLRKKGTELPFTGKLLFNKKKGAYHCAACGNKLFSSETKFDSGSGWPSFFKSASKDSVKLVEDKSLGMKRVEVVCKKCGGHLGHVFDDGPKPTGKRFCINSAALGFKENKGVIASAKTKKATFGAGCFWHVEEAFRKVSGVIDTTAGYMGGKMKNPSYKDVCTNKTGHAEVCQVEFNPKEVSYEELLEVFWRIHDPTSLNRQGLDVGTQYRSVIFYHDAKQKAKALASKMKEQKKYKNKIVTEIVKASKFYKAEDYHQGYLQKIRLKTCFGLFKR